MGAGAQVTEILRDDGYDERCREVSRRGWTQGLLTLFANFDGALFVFVFATFLVPDEGPSTTTAAVDAVVFAVIVGALGAAGTFIGRRHYLERVAWLLEGRPATLEEQERLIGHARSSGRFAFGAWLVAAAVFGVLHLVQDQPAKDTIHLVVIILLGGVVAALLTHLLVERTLRPLVGLALAGRVHETAHAPGVRFRLVLTWTLASGVPLLGVASMALRNDGDIRNAVVALALAGAVAGAITTVLAAKAVAEPLDAVREALRRVEDGDLSVAVTVDDAGDIGRLQAGVNAMVEGLRERQRLADLFGRHVGAEVAAQALAQGSGLESEVRDASVLFVDIIGSTAMAEVLPPQEVVRTLNAFFGAVVAAAGDQGGWVNKFEGDGALCVFGAPATQPDHAARALRAAVEVRRRVLALASAHPGLDAAVGVSSGQVVAGNVGTETRYEYTVIGRPVNEAARLSELAKGRPERILASGEAVARAGAAHAAWADVGTVALRGQQSPTTIFCPAASITV